MREVGAGGEGKARGTSSVDPKQGTWVDGEFTAMKNGTPIQVLYFFQQIANMHLLDFVCVQNKREFSVQVKNKPHVGIQNMRLFLVHQSSW